MRRPRRLRKAVLAAANLASKDAVNRIQAVHVARHGSMKKRASSKTYSAAEIVAAIHWCRDVLGHWPTMGEFVKFGDLERYLARKFKRPIPRIPVRNAWERGYGKWDACLRLAKRMAAADAAS